MNTALSSAITRRALLLSGGSAAVGMALPNLAAASIPSADYHLVAEIGRVDLMGTARNETDVWCYGGRVPGPELRVRQGQTLRVRVENRLAEETTVHWHGVRVPNDMDGVPLLTQEPIASGEFHDYSFSAPDAGTFWYHPHQRGFEQVGRGLYGPLIVEEHNPIDVDREVTWLLDDWRLSENAEISGDFGNFMDMSHAGRIGNTVTINGRVPEKFAVQAGERIRLRLINAANARIFGLEFGALQPWVIALDGQPVEPHQPSLGRVLLGPAMRADLIFDMLGDPGATYPVKDLLYKGLEYQLTEFSYSDMPPEHEGPLPAVERLPDNPLPEPDMRTAERHVISFQGGMMGQMSGARMGGQMMDMRTLRHHGKAWAINGIAAQGHVMDPLLTLRRGRSYVLELHNDTAWPHPIHLHGHSFRVMTRDGKPTEFNAWQDTVLMSPRERTDIVFVADNPGDWMFHCHILEHMAGGMMGVIRVA